MLSQTPHPGHGARRAEVCPFTLPHPEIRGPQLRLPPRSEQDVRMAVAAVGDVKQLPSGGERRAGRVGEVPDAGDAVGGGQGAEIVW